MMFDNPQKELQQLEDRLLAAEDEQWEQPEEPEDPDTALEEVKRILQRSDWEEAQEREPLYRSFLPREEDPEDAEEPEEEPQSPQKPGRTPVLLAALLVETALLLGVIAWWLLWR